MAKTNVLRVTLRYADISALFERPAVSPFADDFREYSLVSGIEYLAKELAADPSLKTVQATILLPPERITPALERQARGAIARYCSARLRMLEQDARAVRWRSTRALAVAFIVLCVAVWLGGLVGSGTAFIPQVIADGLVFGSWVAIWFPLDSLVFGTWQIHLERVVYRRLTDVQLTIGPAGCVLARTDDPDGAMDMDAMDMDAMDMDAVEGDGEGHL